MLFILLMEMFFVVLAVEGMLFVLGYGMFIFGLFGYFGLDCMLLYVYLQDLM